MHFEVVHPGSNAMVVVKLVQGESIKAEAGAMVAKSDTVTVEGKMEGGLGKAVKRFMFGGERFFFQTLKAESGPGEVLIAPAIPGDIQLMDMGDGQDYVLQGGAFLAAIGDISIDTRMQKLSQALFSGEGLFVLHCTGKGTVAASAFGPCIKSSCRPDRTISWTTGTWWPGRGTPVTPSKRQPGDG